MAAEKKDKEKSVESPAEKNKVVRVSPYPIDSILLKAEGQPPIPCSIVRLEEIGIIFKAGKHLFRPGEEYKCNFEVPTFRTQIHEAIKIIKTYENIEAYTTKGTKERVLTVEAHFKSLTPEAKMAIRNFVVKIGQKKL